MEELARDNMPFMGLEIHGLEELTLKQVRIFNLHKIFYFIKCPKFYFIFLEFTSYSKYDESWYTCKNY